MNYQNRWATTAAPIALGVAMAGLIGASDTPVPQSLANPLADHATFVHIPGPNPILMIGDNGSWDDIKIEASDALRDHDTYYLFYHGYHWLSPKREGFQIGVATSTNPLGPFERHENNPILPHGPPGSWDENNCACAMVLKDDDNKYYMFYSGLALPPKYTPGWSIGLAVADHPLGPWRKYDANPVLDKFGYLNSVVKVNGKYYLYAAHPVGSIAPDYSPFSLATAHAPTGPWTIYHGNPILKPGQPGEWDEGGFSESEVLYQNGVFHTFYGGSRTHPNRMHTRENLGYAYSFNGYDWIKYGLNPVARVDHCPPIACFAEVHTIMELPFIYVYHTQRYTRPCTINGKHRDPADEDLGVQVLVTRRPFSLNMPLIHLDSLSPGQTLQLDRVPALNLGGITRLVVTVECQYHPSATKGLRLHLRSSHDGLSYETMDFNTLEPVFKPGCLTRKAFPLDAPVKFIKVLPENLDPVKSISDLKIVATLKG